MPRYIVEVNFFVDAANEDAATAYVETKLDTARFIGGSVPFVVAWTEEHDWTADV